MRGWSGAVCVAVAVLTAACTASEPESEAARIGEVRIGVLAPLSGADEAVGADSLRGAQLAAALVNGEEREVSLAGVGPDGPARLGGKVTIVPGDTTGTQERGASEAVRLVTRERAVALVGAYHTDVTNAASQRSERLRVPFVNGDTSADFLTQRGLDWFFRTGPTDRILGESFFSALGEVGGNQVDTIGILGSDDQPGIVLAALVDELAGQGGYRVVSRTTFPADQDPTAAVAQVRGTTPDAVFVVASSPDQTQRVLAAFGRLGYTPPGLLVFGAGFVTPVALQAARRDAQGLLYSAAWSREVAGRNPAAKPVMELYEERYGAPMTEVAASSFTAVLTVAKAMADAGSAQPDRVRAALLNLDIPGRDTIMPWNGVRFEATHQNSDATGVVEQVDRDAFRVVFPDELAQGGGLRWPLAAARGRPGS